jgi:hypothetical protein
MTDDGNLFPVKHLAHTFTTEEVEDILRFADEHGIHGANEAKLIAFVRDVRAAHLRRARSKGVPQAWPIQPSTSS